MRRSALALLLFILLIGPLVTSFSSTESAAIAADESSSTIEADVAGRSERLKFTGTAVRKWLGVPFFRITAYCDTDAAPADVDALAAADVPKRLTLVMQRDIPDSLFRKGFRDAFADNDPGDKFLVHRDRMLGHLTAKPLTKGDVVTLTHLPQTGVECRVGDGAPLVLDSRGFAHVVWNVYMGPRACSLDLRKGLGTELARD